MRLFPGPIQGLGTVQIGGRQGRQFEVAGGEAHDRGEYLGLDDEDDRADEAWSVSCSQDEPSGVPVGSPPVITPLPAILRYHATVIDFRRTGGASTRARS